MKKQVLVTGANKGIGYEIARHLGKSGWQVVVGARCEDRALKAMEALRTDGADVAGWQYVNLADNGEIEVSAREIAEKYPGLSLLVNNAGIPGDMSVRSYEQSLQDVIDTVQVNYIGTFYLTKLLLPLLEKKLHGFAAPDAVLTAVETRSSSPVRIVRDNTYQTALRGLYPCGEGAGYAGGILSAAADGMRCAEQIIKEITQHG